MSLRFNTDQYSVQPRRHARTLTLESLENRCVLSGSTCGQLSDRMVAPSGSELQAAASALYRPDTNLGTVDDRAAVDGWVGWSDRYDMFRFELETTATTTVRLNRMQSDLDLTLYDAGGNEIASSDRPYSYSEEINRQLAPGVYYALVYPYQSYNRSSYRFRIDVQPTRPPEPPVVPDRPASAPSVPQPPSPPQAPPDTVVDEFPEVGYYGGTRQWNINSINAPEVWAQGYTGEGVVVAVVDTGVDLDHSDLVSNIWTNAREIPGNRIDDDGNGYVDDVHGWDFAGNDSSPNDVNGHGTHVAGTIASLRNSVGTTGIAYNAEIMPVQVLGSDGSGSIYDVAAGIRYAVDNGADVINLSLGSGGTSSIMASALSYAHRNDVFVVAASGNSGGNSPDYPARYGDRYTNVLSVGAYSSSEAIAGFSNAVGGSGVAQVDAPGVGVYSSYAGNRAASLSGTSMATPHVAGLAALALNANPNLSPSQLRSLIVDTADQPIRRSDSTGGINAARSVAQALNVAGTSPRTSNATASAVAQSQSQVRFRFRNVTSFAMVDTAVTDEGPSENETGELNDEPDEVISSSRRAPLSLIADAVFSRTPERRFELLSTASERLSELALSESDFLDSLQELV